LGKSNISHDEKDMIRNKIVQAMDHYDTRKHHLTYIDKVFNKNIHMTKDFLKENDNIIFTKSDKGNVTVCLERAVYIEKMTEMLNDKKTYELIDKDPLKKLQTNVYEELKYLNDNGLLEFKHHKYQLTQTNTNLAKCYGLPKIHKPTLTFRPIISSINSPTQFLSNIILKNLKKCISQPKSHIHNSFDLLNKIKNLHIPRNHVLVSLDVVSLFTKVTLEQVLKSLDKRFTQIHGKSKIPFNDIRNLTEFLFENVYFTFNDKIYRQISGTPMGSAISPIFADIVLDDLETACLERLKTEFNISPLFYYRYVDDTIMCINKRQINKVLTMFNSHDTNLKFTHEIEENGKINFLDLTLSIENNIILTDWYIKPISSNTTINFHSNHSKSQKINIISYLVDRAIKLSENKFHNKNINLVKKILIQNEFPKEFFEKYIKKRLYTIKYGVISSAQNDPTIDKINLVLPFYDSFFKNCKSILKNSNFRVVPGINNKITDIVKLGKDVTKKEKRTSLVYKISCNNCQVSYVGQTKRTLKKRISEHKKNVDPESVVYKHRIDYNHDFNFEDVKILDTELNYRKRLISEMLLIKGTKNTINKKEDTQKLSRSYKPLFKKLSR